MSSQAYKHRFGGLLGPDRLAIQDGAIFRALDQLDCRKLDAIPRDGRLVGLCE